MKPVKNIRNSFILSASSAALAAGAMLTVTPIAAAQDAAAPASDDDMIIVTGTRREGTVQDVPINISAIGATDIEEQGIQDLAEIASLVPGVFIVDQGARAADRIVVRGLNADPLGSSEGLGNGGGGTVATYVGEIPVYVDLKLNDMDRVEFLLGPQGSLYGAGTMGGAIRYIPNKPDFGGDTLSLRGQTYGYSESDGLSYDIGATMNVAVSDTFAIRASLDYLDDSGFIDYKYAVKSPGTSDPDPDWDDPADIEANTYTITDANWEETVSGRLAARWLPTDAIDATLTYYFQGQDVGARTVSSERTLVPGIGEYESALRVPEPNSRDNHLLSLEVIADLGWAELTSATGYSRYDEEGQRDQTDLLITLEYSYEAFPNFTAYTLEEQTDKNFTQEVRLVSQWDSPFSWIIGGFYNDSSSDGSSKEFTPGFGEFAVAEWGADAFRPDKLEYYSVGMTDLTEQAVFGEVSWDVTDAWQVTAGGRYYEYELSTLSAVDFPLLYTMFYGRAPDETVLDFEETGQEDDGFLYKFNTSYQLADDILLYGTVSQGYRIGNSNGIAQCGAYDPDAQQGACALAPGQQYGPGPDDYAIFDERQYGPDKTTNYEIGAKTTLADGRLLLNGAVYYIDWSDPQVSSATVNASIPITINASGAESKGVETSFDAALTDHFSLVGAYSYTKTELTDDVPQLIRTITTPGFGSAFEDGKAGDRLPGSPEHKYSVAAQYEAPLMGGDVLLNYRLYGASTVLTRTGGRGDSVTLDGYSLSNVSARYSTDDYSVTLFVNNLYNDYVETGIRSTPLTNQIVYDQDGGEHIVRSHFANVLPPREIGIRYTRDFGM